MSCIPCPYTAVYHVTLDTQFAPTFCMLKEAYFGYKRRSSISNIASPRGEVYTLSYNPHFIECNSFVTLDGLKYKVIYHGVTVLCDHCQLVVCLQLCVNWGLPPERGRPINICEF